jgi:hypothetical protein
MSEILQWSTGLNGYKKHTLHENHFTTELTECQFEPGRNLDNIFVDHLINRPNSPVELLYSGGSDSELVLISLMKNKIPVEVMTMVIQIKGITLFNIANFGFKGDSNRAAILPTDSNTEVTDIGSSGKPFAHGNITIMTSNTSTVKTTLNAQTIATYSPNGEATTVGSQAAPFDNVYAYNIHAVSGFSGPLLANTAAPTSVSSTGTAGEVAFDSTHIYVCVANNTWRRANLTTW